MRVIPTIGVVFAVATALAPAAPVGAANCARTTTGLVPIPDLRSSWNGYPGGLYPGGSDQPPRAYEQTGGDAGRRIQPVNGKIALLSIGMSNATQEFSAFVTMARSDAARSPAVTVVDGAQGGQSADRWVDPGAQPWQVVEARLQQAGAQDDQVRAIWLKEADPGPTDVRAYVTTLTSELRRIVLNAAARYPNLRQVFVSPRTYGGYATSPLNPEPFAYATGFADQALVADSVADPTRRPWVGWGPYIWTDGTTAGPAGFSWTCADVQPSDGTHPSAAGMAKVAGALQAFFEGSEFTPWYRGASIPGAPVPPLVAPASDAGRWAKLGVGVALALIAGAASFLLLRRVLRV
ncbi:MAG TPA: hypothetical protein VF134_01645 [Candidatus Dormibacteraeota bacterium]